MKKQRAITPDKYGNIQLMVRRRKFYDRKLRQRARAKR